MNVGLRGGKVALKAGKVVNCACCGFPVPPCCTGSDLPSGISADFVINGLIHDGTTLFKVGNGFLNTSGEVLCDFSDGHRQILLDIAIQCSGTTWSLLFSYSIYTDGVLGNYVQWQQNFTVGVAYDEFQVACNPFVLLYTHNNTSGQDADGASVTCTGVAYPFSTAAGAISLQLQIIE